MPRIKPFRIRKVTIGGKRPVFILGPCVIESEKFIWRMAREIAKICKGEDVDLVFKASYDKANRTSVKSFRGFGAREGCEILAEIGKELKVPVTTDVHSPDEAKLAGGMIDHSPRELRFIRRMHVRCHRNFQLLANLRQNFAAFARAKSAKRFHRSAVRFVVGSFENKIDILAFADLRDLARHSPNELFRFDDARAENKNRPLATDRDLANAKWSDSRHEPNQSRNARILKTPFGFRCFPSRQLP